MVAAPESNSTPSTVAASPARTARWPLALLAALGAVTAYSVFRTSEATGQLTAIERERVSLMQEKSRLDTALAAARKQVDELKSLHSAAESEIKKSREDAKAASTQSVQFQERAKAFEAELGTVRGQMQARDAEFDKVRQEAAGAGKMRSDLEARAVGIERDMSARLSELQQRLDETQKRLQLALEAKDKAERMLQQPGSPQLKPPAAQPQAAPQPPGTSQPTPGAIPMRL